MIGLWWINPCQFLHLGEKRADSGAELVVKTGQRHRTMVLYCW